MTTDRAMEILDPTHREQYENIDIVNEACMMGRKALSKLRKVPLAKLESLDTDERFVCVTKRGYGIDLEIVRFRYRQGELIAFDHGFRSRMVYGKEWYLFPIDKVIAMIGFDT